MSRSSAFCGLTGDCLVRCHIGQAAVVTPPSSDRSLPFLVALDVVLEMEPGIEGTIGLLRLVFQIDLGELHRDALRGRSAVAEPLGLTPVMITSFILMIRYSCWPLPALRTVIVASLMCSPVAHAFSRTGDALSTWWVKLKSLKLAFPSPPPPPWAIVPLC